MKIIHQFSVHEKYQDYIFRRYRSLHWQVTDGYSSDCLLQFAKRGVVEKVSDVLNPTL